MDMMDIHLDIQWVRSPDDDTSLVLKDKCSVAIVRGIRQSPNLLQGTGYCQAGLIDLPLNRCCLDWSFHERRSSRRLSCLSQKPDKGNLHFIHRPTSALCPFYQSAHQLRLQEVPAKPMSPVLASSCSAGTTHAPVLILVTVIQACKNVQVETDGASSILRGVYHASSECFYKTCRRNCWFLI